MFGPVMAGERVRLEPPRGEYAPAYLRWFADREVTRYLMVRHPTSLKKQDEWLEQMAASTDDVLWAIVRATDGGLIGNLGLHQILWRHQRAELGYVIGERDQWGKGYHGGRARNVYAFLELAPEGVGVGDRPERGEPAGPSAMATGNVVFRRDRHVEAGARPLGR